MSGKLEGRVAVVTGRATGIVLPWPSRSRQKAHGVFVTGRRPAELDAAVKEIGPKAIGICSDVLQLADLDRLCDAVQQHASHIRGR
ncbi:MULTISPECIES: hypothetical protein [Rhodomicrobium]|uniref:hypothetical protein n=1 Tax=Rhodomicrobium TaxID=1068 RepID=UPI000F739773|nr:MULTISPECIES: hypothetical protein [Rhodomicrobium]